MATHRKRGRPPGPTSRRSAIAADIARQLESGAWPIGKPIPSYRQLAARYRVCVTTIRLVLHALSEDGRLRLNPRRKAIASVGAPAATLLNGAVAIVMRDQFAVHMLSAENAMLWRGLTGGLRGTNNAFFILQDWRRWRTEFPAGLRDLPLAGVILLGPFAPEMIKHYETLKLPVMLVDQPGDEFKLHSVSVANYEAAFDATQRLIGLGHRHLAFVRTVLVSLGGIDPDSRARQDGFLDACRKHRLRPGRYKVFSTILSPGPTPALAALVRAAPRFTAVVCNNVVHAAQTARAAETAGLNVPRDLSIVAFRSPTGHDRDWSGPQIDFEEIGRRSAELLLSRPRRIEHVKIATVWHEGISLAEARR